MYYFAKKPNGEEIILTEKEALIMTENNNVSQRMRLQFIGTCEGKNQVEAKKVIQEIIASNRPQNYNTLSKEDKNVIDAGIRHDNIDEIKKIRDEALQKDREEAEKNGFIPPRKELHIHTPRGERGKIMNGMSNMV